MQNLNQFEIVEQNELEQVQGGVGLSIVIGGFITCCRCNWGSWLLVISYIWLIYLKEQMKDEKLSEKFDIMTDADLSVTEGGIVVTTSTAVAWGVLGVVTYLYGRHLGSRR